MSAPWTRRALTQDEWASLANDPVPQLLALWADTRDVYALMREEGPDPLFVSTQVEAGAYPALSPTRPLAVWFERMVHDLWGHVASGGTDQRPLLDHGAWPHATPMALRPGAPAMPFEPEEFASDEDGLDQIPLGPIRGLIEPAAHLRLTCCGENITRLEARLGYTHKGTLTLMRGKSPRAAARFAARICGEATVAHSIAFARATEAALQCEIPPRAMAMRDVMAGVERIVGHLDALAAVSEAIEIDMLAGTCARHAEALRRAAGVAFGHRLMMDSVIPGGLATDIAPGGPEAIGRALATLADELPEIEQSFPLSGGVAAAAERVNLRLAQMRQGIPLLRDLLRSLPGGIVSVPLPPDSGEGLGFAEAANGEVWHWLRLDHGQIASVFMRDPAWTQWPLLEAAMTGGQTENLELLLAAFGLSSSGLDL